MEILFTIVQKTANELNNAELNHHLILKFPLIASDDQQMMFRFL